MKVVCDKCGAEFNSFEAVEACPQCGELQRTGKKSSAKKRPTRPAQTSLTARDVTPFDTAAVWFIALGVIGVLWAMWSWSDSAGKNLAVPADASSKSILEVIEGPVDSGSGVSQKITGLIRNNGPDLDLVMVDFALYRNGARVGTASDVLNNMKSGDEWRFSASGFEPFDEYSQINVTGY